ncbi:MAG TPA: metallophosphoesterase [Phycisphaerae bacterium]|nr:metallophosphoesterase [Phycisphaerae bacterium]
MWSVATIPGADRSYVKERDPDKSMGRFLKGTLWYAANCCLLGGLLTWPLERNWLRIEELPMPLGNLGLEFDGVRLVHLSDLHCGTLVREKHLRRYVEIVNELDADFVAVTGDFITTGSRRHARAVAGILRDVRARRAVVACLGNHDYGQWHPKGWGSTRGIADFLSDALADAGVMVLRNASKAFFMGESALQFVGVEDYWSPNFDPQAAFEWVDVDSPVIALAHNPDVAPQLAAMGAGWILAGHTHGKATPDTRFWDVVYPTRHKQFVGGQYALRPGRNLYVNRGIGNTLRVCRDHRPEITLFTLRIETRRRAPSRIANGTEHRSLSFQKVEA